MARFTLLLVAPRRVTLSWKPPCGHAVGQADGELRERREATHPADVLDEQLERLSARGLGAHCELPGRLAGRELDVAREGRDAHAPVGAEVVRGREREGASLERDRVEGERPRRVGLCEQDGRRGGREQEGALLPVEAAAPPPPGTQADGGERFSLYVIDGQLPDAGGLSFCEEIRRVDKTTPVVFFTGKAFEADREVGTLTGASAGSVAKNILATIDSIAP